MSEPGLEGSDSESWNPKPLILVWFEPRRSLNMALGSGLRPVADLILALNLMSSYLIIFTLSRFGFINLFPITVIKYLAQSCGRNCKASWARSAWLASAVRLIYYSRRAHHGSKGKKSDICLQSIQISLQESETPAKALHKPWFAVGRHLELPTFHTQAHGKLRRSEAWRVPGDCFLGGHGYKALKTLEGSFCICSVYAFGCVCGTCEGN